ncbi:MAG TPA: DnaD domain protein [Ruminiclostridium sp.]|uniref:DNA replication protein DnaD n=1 Tax=Acetivibrio saccincola TaxID=1677857 RepID=A0A2K9E105_9FIRM|nr:DnaD domain protein [Acetivibrio saccincola]HAA43801.1 DnaD domain protein [Ruminiclostridium sp.]AUG56038.1 Replication initiation and membrane attachment [Acetivibrio saccincola]NLW27321.1 DnaD domain protein [Acetivibrio saccincola]PQQ65776.1 DNA replication protein DnaD [Acetivibrio saccincola]HOA96874.1 DnaD domain protein [Acetivibrio saccincola]
MFFDCYKSILYSDTLVPDIFITEHMPLLDSNCVKVYLYCLFLSKHNKRASTEEFAKNLNMDVDTVKHSFTCLDNMGILTWKENGIQLHDLKEKEIKKMYRLKTTSTPEEAVKNCEKNKRRNEIISTINNTFFQGVMSPSWYTDIDTWFDRFKFDEDVMLALFQYCFDQKGLSKPYIEKVAESWKSRNIKNSFDLDNYSIEYEKFKDVRKLIVKKLKLNRNLTEYEEKYVETWVMDYKYSFEIIELALKKTTSKTNPNFNYIHSIITDWYKNGFKTKEEILMYDAKRKKTSSKKAQMPVAVPQKENFEQRRYDEGYLESLYENA